MSLRQACSEIARARLWLKPLPDTPRMVQCLAEVEKYASGGTEAPHNIDLDEVAARVLAAYETGNSPSRRDLRATPWCLWTTRPALAEHAEPLQRFLRDFVLRRGNGLYRRLASSYLLHFALDRPQLEAIGGELASRSVRAGKPWADLQERYQMFHAGGVGIVAREALQSAERPINFLRKSGLRTVQASSGYARAVHAEGLAVLARGDNRDPLERLNVVKRWSTNEAGGLVHGGEEPQVLDALLRPFGGVRPEKTIRDQFLSVIVAWFGDPRLHAGRWARMQSHADTVRGWLTEQSLRQFFDVIDEVAPDRHWKYRRAFWRAYYDQGDISEAWAILDPSCADVARKMFGKDVSFARWSHGGSKQIQAGHAVLLLRIGRCLVADWSHSGSCNIWDDAQARDAPKLWRSSYHSDEIRHPPPRNKTKENLGRQGIFYHQGTESYSWQHSVASFLFSRTNVSMQQKQYRV